MLLDKRCCDHINLLFIGHNTLLLGDKSGTHLPSSHACPCEAVWGLQQPQCQQPLEGSTSSKVLVPGFLHRAITYSILTVGHHAVMPPMQSVCFLVQLREALYVQYIAACHSSLYTRAGATAVHQCKLQRCVVFSYWTLVR